MNNLSLFKAHAPYMNTFDRLSFSNAGVVGKTIRFFTRQNVNHTGAVLRFNKPDWLAIAEADPEVMVIDLERKLEEYNGSVYWHPLKKKYHKRRNALGKKMMDYTGIGYDWVSLIVQAIKRVKPNAKNMFCSEMVFLAGAFLENNPLPTPDEFRKIAPQPGEDMDKLGWWDEGIKIVR